MLAASSRWRRMIRRRRARLRRRVGPCDRASVGGEHQRQPFIRGDGARLQQHAREIPVEHRDVHRIAVVGNLREQFVEFVDVLFGQRSFLVVDHECSNGLVWAPARPCANTRFATVANRAPDARAAGHRPRAGCRAGWSLVGRPVGGGPPSGWLPGGRSLGGATATATAGPTAGGPAAVDRTRRRRPVVRLRLVVRRRPIARLRRRPVIRGRPVIRRRAVVRRRTPRRRRRVRAVVPVAAVAVPRTAAIVIVPVRRDAERDQRQSEQRSALENDRRLVLVRIRQELRIDKAAIRSDDDVAPAVSLDAADDIDLRAAREPRDLRILAVRTRADVDGLRRVGDLRQNRNGQQTRGHDAYAKSRLPSNCLHRHPRSP